MGDTILITGGTGLIGSVLSPKLESAGYKIRHLSRHPSKHKAENIFKWDVKNRMIDPAALEGISHVIHLAGAGVADARWTEERKQEIIDSRVDSANLIFDKVIERDIALKTFISASATGIYGADTGEKLMHEESNHGVDFLAEVCERWESAALNFRDTGARVAIIRTGIVFSTKGGALEKMLKPIRFGLGAPLGSGHQYIPWIHIDDICNIYLKVLEDETLQGPYNAVAPEHATNKEVTKEAAEILNRPLFLPNVPSFLLKMALGDMASAVLGGNRVSSDKIEKTGFNYNHPRLAEALTELISNRK